MKFITKSLIVFLIFVLSTSAIYSQYLVELSQKQSDTQSLFWYYENQNSYFAAIENVSEFDQKNINYRILDEDIETGKFFWVNTRFDLDLNRIDLSQDDNSKILWNDNKSALVKVKNVKIYSKALQRQYFLNRIDFSKKAQIKNNTSYPIIESKNTNSIQSIIDSVSMDELYLTEEHLTGLRPYMINGYVDSMQSRYSYSPQIYKAQDYLESRFEDYGYNVDYLPFAIGTFYDIQFVTTNPNIGWLITVDKVFGTQNGGLSWTLQYEGTSGGDLWSVFAYDQNTAFAVGENGRILKTSDGSTWQQLNASTSAFLFGVQFKSSTLGWICGDTGLLLKTTDGGANWSTKSTPTSQRLYDIYFVNDSTGWAVGRNGAIIYTNNYGESWTLQTTPTSERLYGVHFKDDNEGFVVGWSGIVLHTTNAGSNWVVASVPSSSRFYDIDFIDQNTGMIVGWDGTCLTTTDGGSSWTSAGSIYQQDIYGFDLINANEAWASGTGIVASSSDFGSNWAGKMDSIPSGSLINLIATKTGTQYPDQHYIICAHYDAITYTTPMTLAPGADDNGTGTVTVLEAARIFKDYDFNYSIKFVLFPGEEQGLYGSEAYAANAAATGEQILGVLNMDMIGYDSDDDGVVEIHAGNMASSQAIGTQLVSNISNFGLSLVAQYKTSNSSSSSDHSPFWNSGFPAIMQIEDFEDFTPHYHTDGDVLSTINQPYFLDNAKLTIGTLAQLAILDTSGATNIENDKMVPEKFVLHAPYPNPFNPTVNIEYSLENVDKISIEIFDLLGKRINTLANGKQNAGQYKIKWSGKNSKNQNVASGIYFLKFKTSEASKVKKLILMR